MSAGKTGRRKAGGRGAGGRASIGPCEVQEANPGGFLRKAGERYRARVSLETTAGKGKPELRWFSNPPRMGVPGAGERHRY